MNKNKLIQTIGIVILVLGGLIIGLNINTARDFTSFLSNSSSGFVIIAFGLVFLIGKKKQR